MARDPKPPNEFDLGLVARRSKPARSLAGGSDSGVCGRGAGVGGDVGGAPSAASVPSASASVIDFVGGPGMVSMLGRVADAMG